MSPGLRRIEKRKKGFRVSHKNISPVNEESGEHCQKTLIGGNHFMLKNMSLNLVHALAQASELPERKVICSGVR
jgi:hypothetical protein